MSMRVTFVYPDFQATTPDYLGSFYTGIAYLSAVLKKEGHVTRLLHITKPMLNRDKFTAELFQTAPHLIAFSSTTNMFPTVQELVGWIRDEGCKVPIICGGVHPTLSAHHALATPGVNMVCVGEGEEAIVELCQKLEEGRDCSDISNIWLKVNGEVHESPLRP
jgi:radical SAM superfamily enzyme YgiQ (UPF0313 family)